jgi:hypothetical protein
MAKKTDSQTTRSKSSVRKPPDSRSPVKARRTSDMAGSGRARSAVTGRFVKKSYAKKHPKTTVVERKAKKSSTKKSRKK